jgi:hypothetical protein
MRPVTVAGSSADLEGMALRGVVKQQQRLLS